MNTDNVCSSDLTRNAILQSVLSLGAGLNDRFDRIVRLTKKVFDAPVVMVNLVSADAIHPQACVGIQGTVIPSKKTFCALAILEDDMLVSENTLLDQRFADFPLVTGTPHIRFYAGCPISIANGFKLGTLCLMDKVPRHFSGEERSLLKDLAAIIEHELDALQLATTDRLSTLLNRRGFDAIAEKTLHMSKRHALPVCLLYFDLNDFKKINDSFGHAEGDQVLQSFAHALQNTFRSSDILCRMGGDEFIALLVDTDLAQANKTLERLRQTIEQKNQAESRYSIKFSVGMVAVDHNQQQTVADLLALADQAMYAHKQQSKSGGCSAYHMDD